MRTNIFRGTGVAVITPFTPEGEVDLYGLREHINRLIDGGVDFVVVLQRDLEYDFYKLEALVNFYKLAGKRWTIETK